MKGFQALSVFTALWLMYRIYFLMAMTPALNSWMTGPSAISAS